MNIHKILSGNPLSHVELRFAGYFALIWFLMDLSEWIDWVVSKFHPVVCK